MQKTVYFLTHRDTGQRMRYYRTLAGARIAQRTRNHRLGFRDRVERVWAFDNWDVERCRVGVEIVDATWCIQEGTIDQEDLCEADVTGEDQV